MSAREGLRAGLGALFARRGATAAALVASVAAVFAGELAGRSAARVLGRALAEGAPSLIGNAALTWLLGAAFAGLLVTLARSCALTAYAAPASSTTGGLLADGLGRAPGMITVRAVELTVEGMLGVGAFALATRVSSLAGAGAGAGGAEPVRAALMTTLAVAPPLALAALTFAAARVAIALVARGARPAESLARGYDFALRRFPSLVRLGFALAVATLPLTVGAAVLAYLAGVTTPVAAIAASAAAAACLALAALWSYAALSAFLGRDPHLVTG